MIWNAQLAARSERGQAQVELLASMPACLLAGLVALQLMAVGYAQIVVDGAVEAGALAAANGADPIAAVRAALPGWAEHRTEVEVGHRGGLATLDVAVQPPSPLGTVSRALEVTAGAAVQAPAGG